MKFKLLLSLLLVFLILKTDGQWDSLPSKTTLIYAFQRAKLVGDRGETKNIIKDSTIRITIDTIVQLKGKDRKLIVFSKCLDDILLNKTFPIIQGDYNIQNDDNTRILGSYLVEGEKNYSPLEVSAIYQINHATFLLTLPKDFFYKEIRNRKNLNEVDEKLLQAIYDSTAVYSIYDVRPSIRIGNDNCPLHSFLIIKGSPVDSMLFNGYLNYINVEYFKNSLFPWADKYASSPIKGVIWRTAYLLPKYGIVKSKSIASNRYVGTYLNFLELKKIELPIDK